MKYIKLYESYQYRFYLIRIDQPYFEYSLDIFNVSEDFNKLSFMTAVTNRVKEKLGLNKIYITLSSIDDQYDKSIPGWMPGNQYGKDYLTSQGGIYQGEIDPTLEDINLWRIKKDTDKYNL